MYRGFCWYLKLSNGVQHLVVLMSVFRCSVYPSCFIYHSDHPNFWGCNSLLRNFLVIIPVLLPSTDDKLLRYCPCLVFLSLVQTSVFAITFPFVLYSRRYSDRCNKKTCYNFSFGLACLINMSLSDFEKLLTLHSMDACSKVLSIKDII